jgi:hypothetical protein
MDPQLNAQLVQTVYVATATGAATTGGPTYGSPAPVSARVESSVKQIRGADGSVKTTSHWINSGTTEIHLNDRLWLPGADHSKPEEACIPLSVDAIPDERGAVDHYETMV